MFALCTVCNQHLAIGSRGLNKINQHCHTKKHKALLKVASGQQSISRAMSFSTSPTQDTTTAAEVLLGKMVAEHNLPFVLGDHFTQLCKVMFPDSKIAQGFQCGRMKTKAIITHALSPKVSNEFNAACQKSALSVLVNSGNDELDRKYFAILVGTRRKRVVKLSHGSLPC